MLQKLRLGSILFDSTAYAGPKSYRPTWTPPFVRAVAQRHLVPNKTIAMKYALLRSLQFRSANMSPRKAAWPHQ
jgi:hypothetical protein